RHLHDREHVLAPALEHRALLGRDRQEQFPGRTTRPAGVSEARDPKLHTVRHARRDVDRDGALGCYPPLAPAPLALRLDLLPRPLARGATAGGHHRAEDAAPDLLDLSGAGAGSAPGRGGPGLRPGAAAAIAGSEGVHRDVPADPERGLLEREQDAGPEVLPPSGSAPRGCLAAPPERPGAEERLEDLADVAERGSLGPT